jgi:ABC-type sugar transport system permease subunit
MAVPTARQTGGPRASRFSLGENALGLIARLAIVGLIVAFCLVTGYRLIQEGATGLAIAFFVVALLVFAVFLRTSTLPLRWIVPGLVFMILFQLYPVIFTVSTAFTNYSTGRNIAKPAVIAQIESQTYVPETATVFNWTPFRAADGSNALWVVDPGTGEAFFAALGQEGVAAAEVPGVGPLDENGVPTSIEGYERLAENQRFIFLSQNQGAIFGSDERGVQITGAQTAARLEQRYVFDEARDAMVDQQTGVVYTNQEGIFTSPEGATLTPGFPVSVGLNNFTKIFTNEAIRGPFVTIFMWTFIWAALSVVETFVLGLLLAITMNSPNVPLQRILRVLLIVPYALPAFITVKIWVGLLNPVLGFIGTVWNPGWFTDPFWAKVGILMVNLWLGYPYMFLITLGALQSIPGDIYEAAKVDGASGLRQFRRITLPLLLVSIGPLLIGSFAFNFNNFAIIDLYNEGGPPIPGSGTPAGYTDILISYTYRIAFGGGRGNDYGLAAAISIIIFLIVAAVTIFNFRYTGQLEEVSENV